MAKIDGNQSSCCICIEHAAVVAVAAATAGGKWKFMSRTINGIENDKSGPKVNQGKSTTFICSSQIDACGRETKAEFVLIFITHTQKNHRNCPMHHVIL